MNDPVYVEAARAFAQRVLAEGGADTAARLSYAWRLALARKPSIEERAVLDRAFQQQLANFEEEPEAAKKLISVGDLPRVQNVREPELAAWTALSNLLLNLNETITN
jgi:hypothetical protein